MSLAISQDTLRLLHTYNNRIENPSLLFEKFLLHRDHGADLTRQKEEALARLVGCTLSSAYRSRTSEFVRLVKKTYPESRMLYGTLKSRMAINLGDGLLENAGIALDRLIGSPYIPASAFKGCCHHTAYWMVKRGELDPELMENIFGHADDKDACKGWVSFLPAHPVDGANFALEILTPHPRNGDQEGEPRPNKYPVVEKGTRFAFIYFLNTIYKRSGHGDPTAIHRVMEQIILAAFENGFGAKTAAGYGWFERDTDYEAKLAETEAREAERLKRETERKQREAAEKARLETERAQQEAQRLAAENRRREQEQAARQAYENASAFERLRMDMEKLSKDDFLKRLQRIQDESVETQRILIEVFKSKNEKNQKRFLKDKKAGPSIKAAAKELGITL
jgi:CRISPR-associated protein Cmr6